MDIRASLAAFAFDAERFESLRGRVSSGTLDPAANRMKTAPRPLSSAPADVRPAGMTADRKTALAALGEDALRAGKVAILILNGGMATRFGGGAKGVVPILDGRPNVSFLAVKLAQIKVLADQLGASIPVVLMHSFATAGPSREHLTAIDWSGIPAADRFEFEQSIMPRVLADGTPLAELSGTSELADTSLFSAPGHGDTHGRLRGSGVLASLRERGVEHILVSNVDNLGASLDPVVLGAHLESVDAGAGLSVEVVRREAGDAGGCVALLPDSQRPAIIEGFRLPEGTDVSDYPHFNTNTLWFSAASVDTDVELTWFAVRKKIAWPEGAGGPRTTEGTLEVVQFETLIGQLTEHIDSAYLDVDRAERFLPIKTRDDLGTCSALLRGFAEAAGLG
ncbi:MAG: UTP--glucose-1-phosphate uridylyltransferase [Myxococcota bacterium]